MFELVIWLYSTLLTLEALAQLSNPVTLAKAGGQELPRNWIPAFAGMTRRDFCKNLHKKLVLFKIRLGTASQE